MGYLISLSWRSFTRITNNCGGTAIKVIEAPCLSSIQFQFSYTMSKTQLPIFLSTKTSNCLKAGSTNFTYRYNSCPISFLRFNLCLEVDNSIEGIKIIN
jgi:hypothetical protein